MGRIIVEGNNSAPFLDYLVPSDVLNLPIGKGLYTVLCDQSAGIIDDIIIFRLNNLRYFVVVNASNLEKDLSWMNSKNSKQATIVDKTTGSAMLAVQGPKAAEVLKKSLGIDLEGMVRFGISEYMVEAIDCLISRSGYTGEDGYEISVMDTSHENPKRGVEIWNRIVSAGAMTCGLGARDTLRLEAGLCLYGQDLNDSITPIEANLGWVVSKDKGNYVGKEIIEEQIINQPKIIRAGLEITSHGIPRKGYAIYKGEKIGEITSGTFSPLLRKGIAMGYVLIEFSKIGTAVEIDVRGQRLPAKIVKPPFYDPTTYGWKRLSKN